MSAERSDGSLDSITEGRLLADRFLLGKLAGEGGDGRVYAAWDRATESAVAVKIQQRPSAETERRFAREVALLARVRHPSIVGFVAEGKTESGATFLVMDWLEGPTLSERLREHRLSSSEVITLGVVLAGALEAIHREGLVHRDLKPGNIVLAGGEIERATLLDFGVAREEGSASPLTRTGMVIGTPGFLAPEQVRDGAVDGRADLFALGAVLYQALTGRRPFGAGDLMTVLARTVLEDPPKIPDELASFALRRLIGSLLAKWPKDRPATAREVTSILEGLTSPDGIEPPSLAPRSVSGWMSTHERRLAALVVANLAGALTRDEAELAAARLRAIAKDFGAELDWLPRGAALGFLDPSELPRRAALAALAVHAVLEKVSAEVALITDAASGDDPVGSLMDRAPALLAAGGVVVDARTAKLLASRFVVEERDGRLLLIGERVTTGLLGKRTTCVGRDRELTMLEGLFRECVDEGEARAVVVKGRAGLGKSRLCRELVERLHGARVWAGRALAGPRGPSVTTRTSELADFGGVIYGLAADLLGRVLSLDPEASPEQTRARLTTGLAALVDEGALPTVAAFLGEIVGAASDDPIAPLVAARRNPTLMAEQIRRAWARLFEGALADGPLVVVLEDIHAADRASLDLVGYALKSLPNRRLFVLAAARPEVDDRFPALWGSHATELRLAPLTPRAATRLAREVLGEVLAEEVIGRIVTLADGNAFYLEELLRAAHEGRGDALPETLVAIAGARLEELGEEDRHLLRAASIFDAAFPPRGVAELVGRTVVEAERGLERLVEREVLIERRGGMGTLEVLFAFRHDLLREAAYASLTERDRALGHRLAARFLATQPGARADVLAGHFERGGERVTAARFHLLAAKAALSATDFSAAFAHASRALVDGAPDLASPHLVLAKALRFQNKLADALAHAEEARARLLPGLGGWYDAMSEILASASGLDRGERVADAVRELMSREPDIESLDCTIALARAVTNAATSGYTELSEEAFSIFDATTRASLARPGLTTSERTLFEDWLHYVAANRASRQWRWAAMLSHALAQSSGRALLGDLRGQVYARLMVGYTLVQLGSFELAEEELRGVFARATSLSFRDLAQIAELYLAEARSRRGDDEGALVELRRLHAEASRAGFSHMVAAAQLEGARAAVRAGRFDEARQMLRDTVLRGTHIAQGRATTAAALLGLGDVTGAIAEARAAFVDVRRYGLDGPITVAYLALARALQAAGEDVEARHVAAEGALELLRRADEVEDPTLRSSFLERVHENVEMLALARAWGALPTSMDV